MYNDDSFLFEGKHKFTTLKNVPPKDLINLAKSTKDLALKEYVEKNKNRLLEKIEDEKTKKLLHEKCEKISYLTEKEAIKEIERIAKKKQENHKPVRIYKCFCGAFHLTSKDFQL